MFKNKTFQLSSLAFCSSLLALALACGGSSSSSSPTSTDVIISGLADDTTGLSKPSFKVSSANLQLSVLDLNTNQVQPSSNVTYESTTGAYSVRIPVGTPISLSFTDGGNTVLSRVLSSTDTASSATKMVNLVTHLQAVRTLKNMSGNGSAAVDTALAAVNAELFGLTAPTEAGLSLTKLPQSMQVALLTFREAASDVQKNALALETLSSALTQPSATFNSYYRSILSGNVAALNTSAAVTNVINGQLFANIYDGLLDETPGAGTVVLTANYQLTFQADWSSSTHDVVPSNAHFSKVIGMNHNASTSLFSTGNTASVGIKNMAETGSIIPLDSEILTLTSGGNSGTMFSSTASVTSPGNTSLTIAVNSGNSYVSMVSMIAPSPDWFIGVNAVNLLENGIFVSSKSVDLFPYDAGSDSGTDFTSPDVSTSPAGNVEKITGTPFLFSSNLTRLGTVTFTKL